MQQVKGLSTCHIIEDMGIYRDPGTEVVARCLPGGCQADCHTWMLLVQMSTGLAVRCLP